MEMGIDIMIKLPENGAKPLLEIKMPVDFSEDADIEYLHEEIGGSWGKMNISRWLMPGLCILYEDLDAFGNHGSELTIVGSHVSVVCYGSRGGGNLQNGTVPLNHLSGTVEIRNATIMSVPMKLVARNRNRRLSIIFSRPFLSKLLQYENWIKSHGLHDLLNTNSEDLYQYFLELPVRHILNDLLNENISIPLKRYYIELKLKELFFILHLQPKISSRESQIPVDVQQKLIAAKAYLLANYHTAPTIKQLSRIVSLNEFQLKHFFKTLFGTTIKSYVIALRMEEAKNLLWSYRSVSDVAVRLGYKNVSHFILIFKRTFGETPRQLMHRQGLNIGTE